LAAILSSFDAFRPCADAFQGSKSTPIKPFGTLRGPADAVAGTMHVSARRHEASAIGFVLRNLGLDINL